MRRLREAWLLVVVAFGSLLWAASAGGLPDNPWTGKWSDRALRPGTFNILQQSGTSITATSPCPGSGESDTGIKLTGTVDSSDPSKAKFRYTGEGACPGSGGSYDAQMSDDGTSVSIRGVTQFGTPFTATWHYAGGGTEPRNPPPPSSGGGKCRLPRAVAYAAAPNEVHVVCVVPDVQFHKGGTPADAWLPVEKDTVLKAGDEISCDPDGSVTLAFADNSTVVVSHTTQLKIGSFFTEGGTVRTEILLKQGELAAQVNKSEATKSDFKIQSPSAGGSVRGTVFTVFADPGAKAAVFSVNEGVVKVDPVNPRLPTRLVRAGKEIEVTPSRESRVSPIGKAGARGGVNRKRAGELVSAVLARVEGRCGFALPLGKATLAVKPASGGWRVSLRVVGRTKGTMRWRVVHKKVEPANALARRVAGGCR